MLSLQLKSKLARTKPSSRGLDIAASYFPRFLWPAGTQALAFPFWPARRIGGDSGIRLEYNASYGSFRGNSFLTARVSHSQRLFEVTHKLKLRIRHVPSRK